MTDPATDPVIDEPAPVRRRPRAALILVAGLAVVIVAAIASSAYWLPLLPRGEQNSDRMAAVSARLDKLEAAQAQNAAAAKSALAPLDQRLRAVETKPPPPPPDLSGIQQQIAALTAKNDALAARTDAVEKAEKAQQAADPTDAALALLTLQIGEAVRLARPFPAEYQSFSALAKARPDIAAAAQPLAEPSLAGIASREVLTRELHGLADKFAAASPPQPEESWTDRIWAQLRGLVTIRRVDGSGRSPAEAAVAAAEKALAGNDLAGAIAALRPLKGADAEAAAPWLRMAEARRQVEDTLTKLTTILAARLGNAAAAAQKSPG